MTEVLNRLERLELKINILIGDEYEFVSISDIAKMFHISYQAAYKKVFNAGFEPEKEIRQLGRQWLVSRMALYKIKGRYVRMR